MHDDDPDDVVHNLFAQQAWGDGPLGRPIAGTAASIESLSRDQIARFHKRHYRPANLVVAAAGNLDHTAVVRLVRRAFGRNGFLARDEAPVVPRGHQPGPPGPPRRTLGRAALRAGQRRAGRQRAHPPRRAPLRPRRTQHRPGWRDVVAAVPGGARAPRSGLQRLQLRLPPPRRRPGRGLGRLPAAPARRRARHGPRPSSPWWRPRASATRSSQRGQGQLRGGLVLGMEDSGARMSRIGKADLIYDELLPARRGDRPDRRRHPRRRPRGGRGPLHPARDPRRRRPAALTPADRALVDP